MVATTAAPARTAPQPAPRPSKMTLASLVKGKQAEPLTVLLYGVEGIGKSTFGANAPKPIFLDGEGGSSNLDVARFPPPEQWEDVKDAVRVLTMEPHDFGTLVVDTLDWIEPLLWDFCCRRDNEKSIESYGYGKGYAAALDEWRVFLAALERLRKAKPMHIVLLAHSWIKQFKNPEADDYDRYELKLHPKAGGLLKEWPQAVLFANHDIIAAKEEGNGKKKRVRGVDTGRRLIYTQRTAAYDAKNRFNLPPSLTLDWGEFFDAVRASQSADPEVMRQEIERKANELGGELGKKAIDGLARADTGEKLSQLNNWLNAKLAEKAEREAKTEEVKS